MTEASQILSNYHHERHFLQIVHVARAGTARVPFIYMKNHKAACTTILATLIRYQQAHLGQPVTTVAESVIHKPPARLMQNGRRSLDTGRALAFLNDPQYFRFTVIRDPIARTVSAYADKMVKGGKQKAALMRHLGRPAEADITLSEFLDIIAQDSGARDVDRHWRSQRKEISYDTVTYDFIGDMRDLDGAMSKVIGMCFDDGEMLVQDTRKTLGHKSDSRSRLEGLSAEDRRNLETALEDDLAMYEEVRAALK